MAQNSAQTREPRDIAAETALKNYKGEQVIFVRDANHFEMQDTYDFSFKMLKQGQAKGVNAIGLEAVTFGQQRIIDAYASGEITRPEFMSVYVGQQGTGQMTTQKQEVLYGGIADAIDRGQKVYGVGSLVGIAGIKPESREVAEKIDAMGAEREIDFVKFKRKHAAEISADPKAFFERYVAATDTSKMTDAQKKWFNEIQTDPTAKSMNEESGYQQGIKWLHDLRHPNDAEMDRLAQEIKRDYSVNVMEQRAQDDLTTAARIKDISDKLPPDKKGMIVVYGEGHSVNYAGTPDIDGQLRDKGVSVMIVEPKLGEKDRALGDIHRGFDELKAKNPDPNRYQMKDINQHPEEIEKLSAKDFEDIWNRRTVASISSRPQEGAAVEAQPSLTPKTPDFIA